MTRPCGRCGEPSTGLVMVPMIVCERVCNRCRADVTREVLTAMATSMPSWPRAVAIAHADEAAAMQRAS